MITGVYVERQLGESIYIYIFLRVYLYFGIHLFRIQLNRNSEFRGLETSVSFAVYLVSASHTSLASDTLRMFSVFILELSVTFPRNIIATSSD